MRSCQSRRCVEPKRVASPGKDGVEKVNLSPPLRQTSIYHINLPHVLCGIVGTVKKWPCAEPTNIWQCSKLQAYLSNKGKTCVENCQPYFVKGTTQLHKTLKYIYYMQNRELIAEQHFITREINAWYIFHDVHSFSLDNFVFCFIFIHNRIIYRKDNAFVFLS